MQKSKKNRTPPLKSAGTPTFDAHPGVTTAPENIESVQAFARQAQHIAEQCKTLLDGFANRQKQTDPALAAYSSNFSEAMSTWLGSLMEDPAHFWETQLDYYEAYINLLEHTSKRMLGETLPEKPVPSTDKRFQDKLWEENVVFDFLKDSYLLGSKWLQASTQSVKVDKATAKRLDFYIRQYIDAISPTNFFLTNPQVLRATMESQGENLVKGLENFLRDLEQSKSILTPSTSKDGLFEVGRNLAVTPGSVVFQNDLMQLIQYAPAGKTVHATPLLIVSPWINKYYILDLQPHNSFIKWLVDQGHTVFVTSWRNVDDTLRHKSFADYMQQGPLAALDVIEDITGEKSTNVIGYCIAGTLMACTLSILAQQKKAARVNSITYLTTLVDFEEPGELKLFTDEEHIRAIETIMQDLGYLPGSDMAALFSILRANDMIWSAVVNQYMLGNDPLPFDLLYWNADSTNLPQTAHSFYLRQCYLYNNLVKKKLALAGKTIDLTSIKTPTYILSTREDHIAPWHATYAATQLYSGEVQFTLSGSGHVAGVINPPTRVKYGYWTGHGPYPKQPEEWLKRAEYNEGSWWPHWQRWMEEHKFLGKQVPARKLGSKTYPPQEAAPGSYVTARV